MPSRPSASTPNPAWLAGVLKMPVSCSVARANSTVDKMRAQFRPWPFARAIHTHTAGTTSPETNVSVMMSGRRWLSWAAVRARPFHRNWPPALSPPMRASTMIKVTLLTAAPAPTTRYGSPAKPETGCRYRAGWCGAGECGTALAWA